MAEFKRALYLLSPTELREWFGVTTEGLSTGFTGQKLLDFRIWVACMALPATATNEAVGKMVEAVEAQAEPEPWGLREVRIVNVNMTSDDDGMVVVSGLVLPNGDHKRAYWGRISRDHRGSFRVETKTGGRPWSEDGIQTVRQAARALAKCDGFAGHISVQIERTN
jgi:hypothetical protein